MVSYTNSNYTNELYDLTGYFNPTKDKDSLSKDELDKRYLLKSGGNITNNLVVGNILDVKNSLTLPNIGSVENIITTLSNQQDLNTNAITTKQDIIQDGDLSIAKTNGLQTALNGKQPNISTSTNINCNTLITEGSIQADNLVVSNYLTGSATIEGRGTNYHAYLDLKAIKRSLTPTINGNGGWYRIRSGGSGSDNGVLSFEKISPQDGTLLSTPLSISNNGDISVSGNLFKPNNPAFKVMYGGANIILESVQRLPYETIIYDTTNSYNTTDFEYVVPVKGKYFFSAGWLIFESSTFSVDIIKNGVIAIRCRLNFQLPGYTTRQCSVFLDCAVNDVIEVVVSLGGIRLWNNPAGTHNSYFEGFKID